MKIIITIRSFCLVFYVEECLEYYIDVDNDKEYLLNYSNQNMNISVNVFNAEEYDNLNLSISVNKNKKFEKIDFTTKVKIFKYVNCNK